MLSARSREYWDFFISESLRQKAPLYFRLAKGVRDDEALSALVAKVRASQPMANARDWLKALVWPDHRERFRRLEDALSAVEGLAVEIRPGDALGLWRLSTELSDGSILLSLGVTPTEPSRRAFLASAIPRADAWNGAVKHRDRATFLPQQWPLAKGLSLL